MKRLRELVEQRCPSARTVLDVACGTGVHLQGLKRYFEVEGLDLDAEMVAIARSRLPGVPVHQADMSSFELDRQFDSIVCLLSSIGYAPNVRALNRAIARMASHLRDGGVLILEPWFTPDQWEAGKLHAVFVDEPELKIARIDDNAREGRISVLNLHYLVATPTEGVTHFSEQHRLSLFTHEEYLEAFQKAQMDVEHDADGLMGRGLYIASR